jgi:hypothetical protein
MEGVGIKKIQAKVWLHIISLRLRFMGIRPSWKYLSGEHWIEVFEDSTYFRMASPASTGLSHWKVELITWKRIEGVQLNDALRNRFNQIIRRDWEFLEDSIVLGGEPNSSPLLTLWTSYYETTEPVIKLIFTMRQSLIFVDSIADELIK